MSGGDRARADERIERLQRTCAVVPGVVPLGGGLPHESLFPRLALAEAFLEVVMERRCAALQYGWPEGDEALRAWIAARLRARGARVCAEDVVVTSGAQQALAIAVDQLVPTGKRVGVDRETYPAALDLFRASGAVPHVGGGPVDWIYAMGGVGNPRGNIMSVERRRAILSQGVPLIVDEAYADLRFDGVAERPMLEDARDRVWHVGTFSKVLCPGVRVGWLVPPAAARDAVIHAKRAHDLQAGSLAQSVVSAFLARDDFESRLTRTRDFYRVRAERLASALRRRLPSWRFDEAAGGFSIFVETELEGDPVQLLEAAIRAGVSFDPGCQFRAEPGAGAISMRLCYSNASTLEDLDAGAARLERVASHWVRRAMPGSRCHFGGA